jgi:hypothetical protein
MPQTLRTAYSAFAFYNDEHQENNRAARAGGLVMLAEGFSPTGAQPRRAKALDSAYVGHLCGLSTAKLNDTRFSSLYAHTGLSALQRLNWPIPAVASVWRASSQLRAHSAGSRSSVSGCLRLRAMKPGNELRPVGWPIGL